MTSRRAPVVSRTSDALTAEDLETTAILAQADRDCDAGLGLRGQDAKDFLGCVLTDARTRVAAATAKRG